MVGGLLVGWYFRLPGRWGNGLAAKEHYISVGQVNMYTELVVNAIVWIWDVLP